MLLVYDVTKTHLWSGVECSVLHSIAGDSEMNQAIFHGMIMLYDVTKTPKYSMVHRSK